MTGFESKRDAAADKVQDESDMLTIAYLHGYERGKKAVLSQPAQEPVAYDKTEINCFAQDLYHQKMREGKHGHYESMFHVIHQCIKKAAPPQREWVGLTEEDFSAINQSCLTKLQAATSAESILMERNS